MRTAPATVSLTLRLTSGEVTALSAPPSLVRSEAVGNMPAGPCLPIWNANVGRLDSKPGVFAAFQESELKRNQSFLSCRDDVDEGTLKKKKR